MVKEEGTDGHRAGRAAVGQHVADLERGVDPGAGGKGPGLLDRPRADVDAHDSHPAETAAVQASGDVDAPPAAPAPAKQQTVVKDEWSKTPRNAPCPCGSGKKFKLCHGATL